MNLGRRCTRLFLILLLLALALPGRPQAAPPPKPRPYSGCGVLLMRPLAEPENTPLPFYAEPGVQRIVELEPGALPRLAGRPEEPLVAVQALKGDWLQLGYDEAGRLGWLERQRSWDYLPWSEYLPGRSVRLLPGLKKPFYQLRDAPREAGAERGSLGRDQVVRVLRVEEEWAEAEAPSGWFKWRDGDGRLTIAP